MKSPVRSSAVIAGTVHIFPLGLLHVMRGLEHLKRFHFL